MNKNTLLILLAMLIISFSFHASASGNHSTKGYSKKNGTYVAPHRQTNPNRTQRDNWGAKGNANPYTGKNGTKEPKK
jgi:hypothetical protein